MTIFALSVTNKIRNCLGNCDIDISRVPCGNYAALYQVTKAIQEGTLYLEGTLKSNIVALVVLNNMLQCTATCQQLLSPTIVHSCSQSITIVQHRTICCATTINKLVSSTIVAYCYITTLFSSCVVYICLCSSTELSKKCHNGLIVYDECGRRCKCEYGKLVKCCRLRKKFTDMTYAERVRYINNTINTVKAASTNPAYKPQYDTLLTLHKTLFFDFGIHDRDFILPWHRWFILQYESLLRQIDCRITVPYWDWSLVSGSPFSSPVWNTGNDAFGGNGVSGGSCVKTGLFRQGVWSLTASAGGGCLTRNFFGTPPDAIAVHDMISSNSNPADFFNLEVALRREFHDEVHCIIDGTMCTLDSATAPEFFLHHGFVDKIW